MAPQEIITVGLFLLTALGLLAVEARKRRVAAAAKKADLQAAADYSGDRIVLHNRGPADASSVEVLDISGNTRTGAPELVRSKWRLPADIMADSSISLPMVPREAWGPRIVITIAWTDADGERRESEQTIDWP